MGLTMATRKTVTKAQAVRYRRGSRAVKPEILDVVCAVTGVSPEQRPSGSEAGDDAPGGHGAGPTVTEV
jgi:hypothetical protein